MPISKPTDAWAAMNENQRLRHERVLLDRELAQWKKRWGALRQDIDEGEVANLSDAAAEVLLDRMNDLETADEP